MITKIILIVYLALSLALTVYTYVQYKIAFANEYENNGAGYDLSQSKILDLLEATGVKVDKFRKVMNILKNYYIEITVILALCSLIMLLYLSANTFGSVNIIARILALILTGLLTVYSVYLYFLIKEYNNLITAILNKSNESGSGLTLQPEDELAYSIMQAMTGKLINYAIGYMAVSGVMTLTALGGTIFGF